MAGVAGVAHLAKARCQPSPRNRSRKLNKQQTFQIRHLKGEPCSRDLKSTTVTTVRKYQLICYDLTRSVGVQRLHEQSINDYQLHFLLSSQI